MGKLPGSVICIRSILFGFVVFSAVIFVFGSVSCVFISLVFVFFFLLNKSGMLKSQLCFYSFVQSMQRNNLETTVHVQVRRHPGRIRSSQTWISLKLEIQNCENMHIFSIGNTLSCYS